MTHVLEATSSSRWKSAIEAANRRHALTTGPVKDGEWYGRSWLDVACTVVNFAWQIVSDNHRDANEAFETLRIVLPSFNPEWLLMAVGHDCNELGHVDTSYPGVDEPLSNFQKSILAALDGRALNKEALAEACKVDPRRLYKPHGLKELRAMRKVCRKATVGYYRPDAPPRESSELPNRHCLGTE